MVPNTYFFHKNQYFVIIELKVFYKSNFQYLFTAENILVKFKMDKSCEEYNARKDDNDNILDLDTMVQFFICPEETRATTDSSMKNETIQFKLSDPKKLADYNLFKSKLFDFNEELMENFSEVQLKSNQK